VIISISDYIAQIAIADFTMAFCTRPVILGIGVPPLVITTSGAPLLLLLLLRLSHRVARSHRWSFMTVTRPFGMISCSLLSYGGKDLFSLHLLTVSLLDFGKVAREVRGQT